MSSGSRTKDQSLSDTSGEEFVENYFENLAGEDALAYESTDLARWALAHRELAETREPGTAVIDILDQRTSSIVMIVTDDMPFLVDSVTAELVRQDAAIRLVVHPTFLVTRTGPSQALTALERVPSTAGTSSGDTAAHPLTAASNGQEHRDARIESWISVEVSRLADAAAKQEVEAGLLRVLGDVRSAVDDWAAMRGKVGSVVASLSTIAGDDIPDLQQAQELLTWLEDGNFTFLGYKEYDLVTDEGGADALRVRDGSGLGLLRHGSAGGSLQQLTDAGRAKARERQALVITKANSRSTVHRAAYLDYIGIKSFDAQGNVDGERRFIGLFATSAYTSSVREVPLVRDKVAEVLRLCGFPSDSHSGKDLLSILETYPRDELFQIEVPDLLATALGILRLQERRRTRLFLRPDIYGRFMSALVYLPRDRYTTSVRLRIEDELRAAFNADSIDFEARLSESALARLFFRIRLQRGNEIPGLDADELEKRLVHAARSWSEGILEVAQQRFEQDTAESLAALWAEAFPPSYRVAYEVEDALDDIARFEELAGTESSAPLLNVYVPEGSTPAAAQDARLLLYVTEARSLTQILPYFHNLGLEVLDERPFEVTRSDGRSFFLYDLGLSYPDGVSPLGTASLLQEAFRAAVLGDSESDPLDRLVLSEELGWRQVLILRAYAKYIRQLGSTNSYDFVAETLLRNPVVARGLIALFTARFDPDLDGDRGAASDTARAALDAALEDVPTLDADRVLRTLMNLIEASLRTNYFQGKRHVSLKFATERIEGAPFPRPKFEIWVYSPQLEGVHLRFGKVARGGLRWSDRREDFRTEVLGLVKAQTVKNAVIVPTGAKGGFFAKQLPDPTVDRQAWLAEGQASYRTFIRGLLDITDNVVTNGTTESIVPPARVVRHDDDDSYLVVAADKGTASFSDIANELSAEYDFWLGDAFASGGSVGYDHKAMAITARGAWESVKRHFSEFDVDTQTEDFTVVGVGDMSGDVFGNGMLRSRHIRLLAAFDHRHIFLDPDPDPETSFTERRRLFDLPRSSWEDYDTGLISQGGGVYPRQAKSVPVSAEVRKVLGLEESVTKLSPPELLRAILRAPADLLYNGGIGTYVKAAEETNAQVGDRANDAIRVNGGELRVRVVGEGGNLGMTQRGRIEAALSGVILNTDAIDNSAGVDCSDYEVNIKIFVDRMVRAGRLQPEERAEFLHSMTDEVGDLVLQDNIDQNILLLNDRRQVIEFSPSYERMIDWLERTVDLDRTLEALPTTAELRKRVEAGQGLTSPELAVLAAYAKIELSRVLTASDLADDPYFKGTLRRYFPRQIVERFDDLLDTHPLRREIISTVVANDIINLGGITFAFRVMEETSVPESVVARAFVALREIYSLDETVEALAALPADFPTDRWTTVYLDLRRLLDRGVRWFVNHVARGTSVDEDIAAFKPLIAPFLDHLSQYLQGNDQERAREGMEIASEWELPEELGRHWAEQFESFALLDIAHSTRRIDEPVEAIAKVYYAVYDRFEVDNLLQRITKLPRTDRWQALARAALRDDLYSTTADICVAVMRASADLKDRDAGERLRVWQEQNAEQLRRASNMFAEVNLLEKDDISSLSVALRLLRSIVR
ncbi:NAD-glutamate dehydrogenase [Arthrobacter echini]|uniref:NAD-glutamate dehydrogenase n=1 Tax=Arthrobacter echini TaxID=1529066 RepID=A0A4S5E3G5_9MICC|nr:NAD-glutamate dehydrogenase [Arthrobacter echini]THJ65968.1 NAD-glutamate dehydrogenase [Arthrobacter echini]